MKECSTSNSLKLTSISKKGSIDQNLYNRLRSSGGSTPLLYGLPKIHKPDVPLRPIVSFVQSPTYQLSKHLTHILSPLIGNTESNVLNSVEFATFIHTRTVHDDEVLVSFDVGSLFTNVPVKLARRWQDTVYSLMILFPPARLSAQTS